MLETSDRRKKKLGDRFVLCGGEYNGAEQWVVASAMPEYDRPRAKRFRIRVRDESAIAFARRPTCRLLENPYLQFS